MALSAPARGYRPRSASNDLKEIVEDGLEEMVRVYDERFRARLGPMHSRVKELFERFVRCVVRCGDIHFGFLRLRCVNPDCSSKQEKLVPFSCKSRTLCPSCSAKRAAAWAERMVEVVLPHVPYVGLTFTIPRMLRRAFLFDRSLYGDLCRAAYQATKTFLEAQFPNLEKPVPAMVVVPQSWGSLLNAHAHCHACSTLGVFTRDGVFHAVPDNIDFAPLENLFREEVFKFLLKKDKVTPERVEMLRSWKRSGFHVDSSRRVRADDRQALASLLEYMERAPVALSRLKYQSDGRALYTGKFNPNLGRDYQLLTGVEFLAMLVPHISLRYEARIHSFGAASTKIRKALGWIPSDEDDEDGAESDAPKDVVVVEEEESEFIRLRRKSWARLIARVYLENPEVCRGCGREMEILSAISSPAQDDVIEAILKARDEWPPVSRYAPLRLALRARSGTRSRGRPAIAGTRPLRPVVAPPHRDSPSGPALEGDHFV